MSFASIAEPFAKMGIPVFPLSPGTKTPPAGMKFLSEASTDLTRIAEWNADNAEYNVALLAGDFCFLEFDVASGMKLAADECDQTVPLTLTQRSGKGFGHYIFRHSDRSRAIGNRSVNRREPCECSERENSLCLDRACEAYHANHHHHEWFSFRAHNKYLVGAGSLHPNGKHYQNVRDVEPVAIPEWLCDYIEKYSEAPPTPHTKGAAIGSASVDEDFDFTDFCDHYGIGIIAEKDGVWQIVSECPGTGTRHENSVVTGFFWDGEHLGWSCFAQGCPTHGMSIGELIRFLNQTHEPYPHAIWPQLSTEELLDGIGWDEDLDDIETISPSPATDAEPQPESSKTATEAPAVKTRKKVIASVTEEDDTYSLVTQCAADVAPAELKWLWANRIPSGKITLLTGKPDCGKTLALLDLVARVSTGSDFPDGERNESGARKVLLAASEDDPADTLIPRLMAAGADLKNVDLIWATVHEYAAPGKDKKRTKKKRTFDLRRDAKALLEAIKANPDISLLALDPITSFFGDADTNKDKDVRPIMDAIAALCQKSGITVLGLIHSNKRSDVDAVQKVLGASSVAGSARAVWGFSRDAEDKALYHMALVKGNLAKKRSGVDYSVEEKQIAIEGKEVGIPHIVWGAENTADANDLLADERAKAREPRDAKVQLALLLLKSNLPAKARDIFTKGEQEGLSEKTIRRAKNELHVIAKQRMDGWWWSLPDAASANSELEAQQEQTLDTIDVF